MKALIEREIEKAIAWDIPQWQPASWEDYIKYRDADIPERIRLFFDRDQLLIYMGNEGINHSTISDLFPILFFLWFNRIPEQTIATFGRCLIEKPKTKAAAPDLVLYIGEDFPVWKENEPRRIDLSQWRIPDLVGEIADTTLATDLDEKKKLYADLEIPEYWVIDVRGRQVTIFQLQGNGNYQQFPHSEALKGLSVALVNQTLERLSNGSNISAAQWFARAIANLKSQ